MQKIITMAKGFLTDETGATMVEYALMVALVAAVAVAGVTTLGSAVNTRFSGIAGSV